MRQQQEQQQEQQEQQEQRTNSIKQDQPQISRNFVKYHEYHRIEVH